MWSFTCFDRKNGSFTTWSDCGETLDKFLLRRQGESAVSRPYSEFAAIYDMFMNGAPHDAWLNFITHRWPDLESLDVVSIGCGTGQLTLELAARCRRVYGVDRSEEMLVQAARAAMDANMAVQWLCQDIREIKLQAACTLR